MINAETFRQSYPEFTSTTTYPDQSIAYWIAIAGLMLPTARWGVGAVAAASPPTTALDFGTELFVAHNLALEKQNVDRATSGATPGTGAGGAVSSKSVGGVSVSYDTGAAMEEGAGHWNLTNYGTRFINLAKMLGAGPMMVGVGCPPDGGANGGAWPGPWPWPGVGGSTFG